ncbi:helix-turn-helix domain-containing protein [Pusillimonas sp. SM2304]|uniref:helix-turn-helix domain-containing protein n=1 Tax=Pusillimonas sp. SM2304 TaxID=3073241 RepID=UPI0028767AEA|nr:helix-turn-helix domain-containing protein [Pusillimonas sp. SM2304]MDS1140330.1 helix-turn-helix domain-containing protein [Pusillimonas sp. SM2304]
MKPNLSVSFFAPKANAALTAVRNKTIAGLQAQGFQVLRCTDVLALHQYILTSASTHAPPVAILSGTLTENCAAATYLRTLHAGAGIVAIVDPAPETDAILSLQSGVDNCFARNASPALLGAILFRLMARAGAVPDADASAAPASGGIWSLEEQSWVLVSPDGVRIALTTGERAFLTALLNAPDLRATHRQLIDAVNAGYALSEAPTHQGRLGVMVSRMRRKFTAHGLTMPLKSVHNWGYMFTGPT